MDDKGKNTFILYTEQWEALKCLTDAQLGKLFRCLYNLMLGTLQMSDVTDDIRIAFMFLKTQINIDKMKYEKRVERSQKANATRWGEKKSSTRIPNDNDHVNDNDNDHVNVDVNANENDNAAAVAACDGADGKPPSAPVAAAAENQDERKRKKKPLTEKGMEIIMGWFNHYMEEANIPCVRKLTPERETLIRAVYEAHTAAEVKKVYYNASQSPFLNSRTKKHFLANFDWIMKEENFFRILEGNFNF